jgi:hypothetical protein
MKKNLLFTALAGLFIATAMISCGDEMDDNDNLGIYTPPADMTVDDFIRLLEEVKAAVFKESFTAKGIRTTTSTITLGENPITMTNKVKETIEMNKDTKKFLLTQYAMLGSDNALPNQLIGLEYIEGYTWYRLYEVLSIKESKKTTDANVDWDLEFILSDGDSEEILNYYDCKVNGDTIIVKAKFFPLSEEPDTEITQKMVLTKDKRYRYVASETIQHNALINSFSTSEVTYTYGIANPVLPTDLKTSDFPPVPQYSLQVAWGNGKSNTFYTDRVGNGVGTIQTAYILNFAPSVAGKQPYLYNSDGTQESDVIEINEDNKVFHVQWN